MQASFICMWIIAKRSNYVLVLGNLASYPEFTGHIVKGKKISIVILNPAAFQVSGKIPDFSSAG